MVKAKIPVNPRNGRRQITYDERGYKVMRSAKRDSMHGLKHSEEQ